jgi:1-deoxy-D-xylulose-5-phosphate synthase
VTFAAGAACDGLKPVVAVYSSFLQRAIDQIVHDVAIQHLNVIFVLDRSGLVGADGPTHHGAMDLTYLSMIPGMVILAPSDEKELRNMLHTALKYDDGPIAVRYPRGNAYGLDEKAPFTDVPIGTPLIVEEGEDLLILAVGHMLFHARQAAETLRGEGLKVTVADVRTVKPLEKKVYRELFSKHRAILTVEDNVLAGGYGTAVASLLSDSDSFDTPIGHVSLPDAFVTHGDIPTLFRLHEMDAEGIAKTARTVLAKIDQPSRVS